MKNVSSQGMNTLNACLIYIYFFLAYRSVVHCFVIDKMFLMYIRCILKNETFYIKINNNEYQKHDEIIFS